MIVQVRFEGVVKTDEKRYVLPDSINIHAVSVGEALEVFKSWTSIPTLAIRGTSGIFHLIGENKGIEHITAGELSSDLFNEKAEWYYPSEEKEVDAPKPEPKPKKKGRKEHGKVQGNPPANP